VLDGCLVGMGVVVGELDGLGVGDGLADGGFWLSAYHDAPTKMIIAIIVITKYVIFVIK
jgi:hypothetical protein